jgi:predicted AAA+ superfamily ATPase
LKIIFLIFMVMPAFSRRLAPEVLRSLDNFPVVALIGPRQCGKTTLARSLLAGYDNALYLDLERPSDLRKLADPEWFLSSQKDRLVCIDEIQRQDDRDGFVAQEACDE